MPQSVNPPQSASTFDDPLANFETAEYESRLQRALVEKRVSEIASRPYASIAKSTSVRKAIEILAGLDVACVMIEDEGELVGIFSEWDVLHNVVQELDESALDTTPIETVMTPRPFYVLDSDPLAAALGAMANCACRHIPVLDIDDKIVGIVSPHRLMSFLEEQTRSNP